MEGLEVMGKSEEEEDYSEHVCLNAEKNEETFL